MATICARLAGFLLLLVAASYMAVAERVVVNVKDEISAGGESNAKKAPADTGTPASRPVVSSIAALRKRLLAEAEAKRLDEKKAEDEAKLKEDKRLADAERVRVAAVQRKADEDKRKADEEQRKAADKQRELDRAAEEAKMKAALEDAHIAEQEALNKFPTLLPGTWETSSTTRNSVRSPTLYNQRWYRIGKSDQNSEWSLPIVVMTGKFSWASGAAVNNHVVYTGEDTHGDNNGIVLEVNSDSPQVRVVFNDNTEATVDASLLTVITEETKALGTLTKKDCLKDACCEKTLSYSRRQKLDHKEAALSVKICLTDPSSGTVEITEQRIKDGKDSQNFFIKDPTTFSKKDDEQQK